MTGMTAKMSKGLGGAFCGQSHWRGPAVLDMPDGEEGNEDTECAGMPVLKLSLLCQHPKQLRAIWTAGSFLWAFCLGAIDFQRQTSVNSIGRLLGVSGIFVLILCFLGSK